MHYAVLRRCGVDQAKTESVPVYNTVVTEACISSAAFTRPGKKTNLRGDQGMTSSRPAWDARSPGHHLHCTV